jgi:hypothetical protein
MASQATRVEGAVRRDVVQPQAVEATTYKAYRDLTGGGVVG